MSKGIMICVLGAARTGSRFVRRVLAEAFDAAQVPWDANYVWMRGARGASDLRGEDEATPALGRHFDRCLRSIAGSTTGAVIEKTVSNSIRPGFVRRALPAARLVALFRSPSAVIRSSARCWAGEVTATDARRKFVSILRWNPGFLTDRILERVRRTPRSSAR